MWPNRRCCVYENQGGAVRRYYGESDRPDPRGDEATYDMVMVVVSEFTVTIVKAPQDTTAMFKIKQKLNALSQVTFVLHHHAQSVEE